MFKLFPLLKPPAIQLHRSWLPWIYPAFSTGSRTLIRDGALRGGTSGPTALCNNPPVSTVALNLPGQLYPAAETTRLAGQPMKVDISVRNIGLRRTSLAERISRTRTLTLQLSLSMVLVLVVHDLEPFKPDSKPHMLMQMKAVPERVRIQEKGQEVSSPGSRSVCSLPGIGQPHSFQLAGRITCSALNDSNFLTM